MRSSRFAGLLGAGLVLSLASSVAAEEGLSLRAAAGSSPRPVECLAPSSAVRHETIWDRAKNPRLLGYCTLLARGYAKLASDAKASATLAKLAEQALPGRAAPLLLAARAALALGDAKAAFEGFTAARKRDETLRLSPAALHDYALAAAESEHSEQALTAYRQLVPMAGLLTQPGHKERVYIEAALVVMVLDPASVQEAVAYLLEARRGNPLPSLKPFILGGLALALDRQGRREEARGVASEVKGLGALTERVEAVEEGKPATGPGGLRIFGHEIFAMAAVVASQESREEARGYWQAYLDRVGGEGPWANHARAELTGGRR